MRKIVVLCLALFFPVFLFLFLKFFGKNQFDVAPLYQQAGETFPADCPVRPTAPYRIPDSVIHRFGFPPAAVLQLLVFSNNADQGAGFSKEMNRVADEFSGDQVSIGYVNRQEAADFDLLKRCVFLLQNDQSLVLIDRAGQIRGQYNGSSLEEMDRLIVELKIILKQYPHDGA